MLLFSKKGIRKCDIADKNQTNKWLLSIDNTNDTVLQSTSFQIHEKKYFQIWSKVLMSRYI